MRFENFRARSGGMGNGNLPEFEHIPPEKWRPRRIMSGVGITHTKPQEIEPLKQPSLKPIKGKSREAIVRQTGWGVFITPEKPPLHKRAAKLLEKAVVFFPWPRW